MNYIEITELPETQNMVDSSLIAVSHAGITSKLRFDTLKQLFTYFKEVSYNKTTGQLIFTRSNNTEVSLSTDLQESIKQIVHKTGDETKLVLTHSDGSTEELSVGTLTGIQMNGNTLGTSGIINLGNIMANNPQLIDNDLNSILVPGFYHAGGSNTCTNKPTGMDAFGLLVYKIAGGWTAQEITGGNQLNQRKWIRSFNGTQWTSWSEMKLTDTTYSNATTTNAGLMSASDKTKVDNIENTCLLTGEVSVNPTFTSGIEIGEFEIKEATTKLYIPSSSASISIPVGGGCEYFGTTAPENFMFADGSALLISQYQELYSVIGEAYRKADNNDTTTFNLPDLRRRYPLMKDDEDSIGATGGSESLYVMANPKGDGINYKNAGRNFTTDYWIDGWGSGTKGAGGRTNGNAGITVVGTTDPSTSREPYLISNYIIRVK